MSLTAIETSGGLSRAQALATAAALERDSLHPLASAFRAHAEPGLVATEVLATAGAGVAGWVAGQHWRLGTAEFAGLPAGVHSDALHLSGPDGMAARFTLADSLREDAVAACAALRTLGVEVEVLSGDAPAAVARVAATLSITQWRARQTPQLKLAAVHRLQDEGRVVMMVGDGINDAAVLAGAQVSVAMADGAALAHAASDVVLTAPRLLALPELLLAARRARRITRQNLAWAIAYNAIGLLLAAIGWLPPWLAAVGMSVSSLAVTLNALRLAVPHGSQQAIARAPLAHVAGATR
jgi:Cu2+-exporting ATPase